MSKLPPFLEDESLVSYTHLKTSKNLDFVPGPISLTLSNTRDKKSFVPGEELRVSVVDEVKEYSCMQGLVALDKSRMGDLTTIRKAMLKVMEIDPPTYT